MGRPKDRDAISARRAREDLDKGLRRRNVDLAVEGLTRLPEAERGQAGPLVTALFREEAERLLRDRAGQQGRLAVLAGWAADEPALLGGRVELTWALLGALLRARDLPRARRLYALIEAGVRDRAPALHAWLRAFLDGEGRIPAEAADHLPRLPVAQPDLRLGYDPPARPRARVPAPRTPEEAPAAVLTLFGSEGVRPLAVAEALRGWLREAPPPVRAALAQAAGPLVVREALQRAQTRQGIGGLLALLADLAAITPEGLAGEAFLGFRLASA